MSREIPMFSARMINSAADYERFFHTRSYIQQRSAAFPGPHSNRALMAACGYRRYEKFTRRRPEWDSLRRDIPRRYLEAIGASLDVLAVAAEADLAEFHAALALPLSPKYAIERLLPAIYGNIRLPPDASEEGKIAWLLGYSKKTGHRCCINFLGLKATFVEPDGSASTIYFPPKFQIGSEFLILTNGGEKIGTSSIGR